MLNVRRLAVLREVHRSGSLAAAAGRLAYTPSAISQQVATLERELGVQLIVRGARGVTFTDAGTRLVALAHEILGQVAAAEEEVRALAGLEAGRLRLGGFSSAGANLVPRAVAVFRERYPRIHITFAEFEPEEAMVPLRARDLDLAIVYEAPTTASPPSGFAREHLVDDPLYIGLPPGHRFAGRRRVHLHELADEDWVRGAQPGSTLALLSDACRLAGFEPRVAFRADDHLAAQGFVAAGLGIAIMPRLSLVAARRDIIVRPLITHDGVLERQIFVMLPSHQQPATAAMIEILSEICSNIAEEADARMASS